MENHHLNQDAFATRRLWGGAAQTQIPASFIDVSDLRQVPDHQECWMDPQSEQLLVLEILEHQASVEDSDATFYFFQDLAESNGASDWSTTMKNFPSSSKIFSVPNHHPITAHCYCGSGYQRVRMGRDFDWRGNPREGQEERRIKLDVGVIRLPLYHTDLLVTLSTPYVYNSEDGGLVTMTTAAQLGETFQKALDSFEILTWSLFDSN